MTSSGAWLVFTLAIITVMAQMPTSSPTSTHWVTSTHSENLTNWETLTQWETSTHWETLTDWETATHLVPCGFNSETSWPPSTKTSSSTGVANGIWNSTHAVSTRSNPTDSLSISSKESAPTTLATSSLYSTPSISTQSRPTSSQSPARSSTSFQHLTKTSSRTIHFGGGVGDLTSNGSISTTSVTTSSSLPTTHSSIQNTTCGFFTSTITSAAVAGVPTGVDKYCTCGPEGHLQAAINIATSGTSTSSYCAIQTGSQPGPPKGFTQVRSDGQGNILWQSPETQCTSQYYNPDNSSKITPGVQWQGTDSEQAWLDAITHWKGLRDAGRNTTDFFKTISQFLNGPPLLQCNIVGVENNCANWAPCQNGYTVAGWNVLESLILVSSMNVGYYTSVKGARDGMTPEISGFSDNFAPIRDLQKEFKVMLDILSIGIAMALAPEWNIVLKGLPIFETSASRDVLSTIKDSINPLISNSITIAKDNSVASAQVVATDQLEDNMSKLVNSWTETINIVNEQIFNGSDASIATLHGLIAGGKMLNGNVLIGDSTAEVPITKTLYGLLIPQAWSLSNLKIHPFILDLGISCDKKPDRLTVNVGKNPLSACINNSLYYIVSATGEIFGWDCANGLKCEPGHTTFPNVPGADVLDGKAWGGVTGDDFVMSALAAKAANGGKNGWKDISPDTISSAVDQESDLVYNGNGIRLPGANQIPICNYHDALDVYLHGLNQNKDNPNYPCPKNS